jgi:hypothetical protein
MLSKEKILQIVQDMPEHFSAEDFFKKVILLQKIEIGLEQSKMNQTVSVEEAKKRLAKK